MATILATQGTNPAILQTTLVTLEIVPAILGTLATIPKTEEMLRKMESRTLMRTRVVELVLVAMEVSFSILFHYPVETINVFR